ncbi:helix-turn-helix domain-containing protein [Agromyces italicus]|uniref:helix-turn-helix domain-containing protein n=1 Tax=Agromyces italicus TaxID=279572 RepID=UPI000424E301|nr:helix-turn-helix domain-containing protein [Agromyces italicus]
MDGVVGATLETAGIVLRVRRELDVSQRELAAMIGVGHSTVARIEASQVDIGLAAFQRLIALAGMRVSVFDADGEEVVPVPQDAIRDNAGRRMPAHLDVRSPEDVPRSKLADVRYDRAEPTGWYHHRAARDERRSRLGLTAGDDHPTRSSMQAEARRRLVERLEHAKRLAERDLMTLGDCVCLSACWESGDCTGDCRCDCGA